MGFNRGSRLLTVKVDAQIIAPPVLFPERHEHRLSVFVGIRFGTLEVTSVPAERRENVQKVVIYFLRNLRNLRNP